MTAIVSSRIVVQMLDETIYISLGFTILSKYLIEIQHGSNLSYERTIT